jgi:predicted flap endonuclease-1-like 5' DNA nuclease
MEEIQMKMDEVEGIGPVYAEQLALAGIATADALLEQGAKPGGRAAIEKATGISGTLILKWVNRIDLMRIKGVGGEYSDLLEAAGVDSPAELANRNAANLATTFQEVVAARPGTVRRIPTETEVAGWIAAAKDLPRVVEH